MKSLKRFALIPVLLIAIMTLVSGSLSCSPQGYSGAVESVTIGTMANAGDTLIFIADEQKYFTLEYIYEDALKEIKPGVVNIIR